MRDFTQAFANAPHILTQGSVGARLRNEQPNLSWATDGIAMAGNIYDPQKRQAFIDMQRRYMDIAVNFKLPMICETPTRRANKERIAASSYRDRPVIADSVKTLLEARGQRPGIFVAGLMGCRGDAYSGKAGLDVQQAISFHGWAVEQYAKTDVDLLFAALMPTLPETIGWAFAASETDLPYVISWSIDRNGCLLDGTPIHDAIAALDGAVDRPPLAYFANCIHPLFCQKALEQPFNRTKLMQKRFAGLAANGAAMERDALDGAAEIFSDTPEVWVKSFQALYAEFPMKILGGCCGTEDGHITALAQWLTQSS